MLKLKVIKKKGFQAGENPHKHYTCAYKGRVFGISTLRFDGNTEMLKEEGDTLSIDGEVEVLKNVNTDPLTGETKTYLDIVPKIGIALAEF